jgi:hypothetical protein
MISAACRCLRGWRRKAQRQLDRRAPDPWCNASKGCQIAGQLIKLKCGYDNQLLRPVQSWTGAAAGIAQL